MSIGFGIFLGSVFLGTVVLYLKTRSFWNWRGIWKRIGLTALGLFALLAIGIGATAGYNKWQERPQVVTSLEGVSLGEKLADVVFRHGHFKQGPPEDRRQDSGDGSERYTNDEKRMVVYVRDGRIESVIYFCIGGADYTSTNGIRCGYVGQDILSRFGNGVRVQCPTKRVTQGDALMRVYDFPDFGVRYYLEKDTVIGFSVMDKQSLVSATGVNWAPCS